MQIREELAQSREDFMPWEEHFDALVNSMSKADAAVYRGCMNSRIETCYRGRSFIVYRVPPIDASTALVETASRPVVFQTSNHPPEVLDKLIVMDFQVDDQDGASCEIKSKNFGKLLVTYQPTRLGDFALFLSLPLHGKLRWSAKRSNIVAGSLGFPLVLRTQSHLSMRECGIVHCETGANFHREFPGITA